MATACNYYCTLDYMWIKGKKMETTIYIEGYVKHQSSQDSGSQRPAGFKPLTTVQPEFPFHLPCSFALDYPLLGKHYAKAPKYKISPVRLDFGAGRVQALGARSNPKYPTVSCAPQSFKHLRSRYCRGCRKSF